jgi:predicted AAA+ superfamily ATPase
MLLKSTIHEVFQSQKELLSRFDTGWERELLNNVRLDTGFVSIITGIRRSGKSTLLKQLLDKRISNYCFFNFEDPRLSGFELDDFEKLDEIFSGESDDPYYVFDEIQNVPQWELFIRYKQDSGTKIILTGSNASLLSRELGTQLTGRHLDYELFPFSFTEFLTIKNRKPDDDSLNDYLEKGGFPEYLKFEEMDILFRLTDDILYRDIAVRYGIKNDRLLKQLLVYFITNSGKLFSYNKLKQLFSFGSSNTIIDYVSFFENSYLLFTVPKFSFSLKKQIYNPKKVYAVDTGLTNVLSASFSKDTGRQLENTIFIYLRKKYKDIFYFSGNRECDFIIKEREKIISAIQVCYELNSDNLDRELNGLLEAMEMTNLKEGIIITLNDEDNFVKDNKTIKVIPAWKFLTEM